MFYTYISNPSYFFGAKRIVIYKIFPPRGYCKLQFCCPPPEKKRLGG